MNLRADIGSKALVLLLCCCLARLWGQDNDPFEVRYVGFESGLPNRAVHVICFDHQGVAWLGTSTSLFRYDGYTFDAFGASEDGHPMQNILAVIEDPKKQIWVGTYAGLFRISPDRKRVDRVAEGYVLGVGISDQTLWFGGGDALWRLDEQERPQRETRLKPSRYWVLPKPLGGLFALDAEGRAYEISGASIRGPYKARFPLNHDFYPFNVGNGNTFCVFPSMERSFTWDASTGAFRPIPPKNFGELENPVGIIRFIQSHLRNYRVLYPREVALNVNYPNCAEPDWGGNLWVGTDCGLFILKPRNAAFGHLPELRGKSIRAILRHEENLYVSTVEDGLFCKNLKTGASRFHPNIPATRHIFPLGNKYFLLAGEYNGVFVWNVSNGQAQRVEGESQQHTLAAFQSRQGDIWVSKKTLRRFDSHKLGFAEQHPALPDSLSGTLSFAIEDQRGNVWINGVARLTYKGEMEIFPETASLENNILYIFPTDSALWLATKGRGLQRYDLRRHTFTGRFNTQNGLPDNTVYAILSHTDRQKTYFWLPTNQGICRFDPATGTCLNFAEGDGLEVGECNGNAYFQDRETGLFYVGGLNGVTFFKPEAIRKKAVQPSVFLSKILRPGLIPNQPNSIFGEGLPQGPVELEPEQQFIEMWLGSTDFTDPNQNRFLYKLEGFDQDWVLAGTNRQVRFTNLEAGHYVFRFKCINQDGVFSAEKAVKLFVKEHFYTTDWFLALIIGIGMGFMYLGYRYRLSQIQKVFQLKKQIANDLHDEVASSLNHLSSLIKLARETQQPDILAKAESISDESIAKLADIVWTIDAQKQSLNDLCERFQDFVDNFFWVKSVPVHMEVSLEQPERSLAAEVRHHVLMVCKEAVNNIARHTDSEIVEIAFLNKGNLLSVRIENRYTQKRSPKQSSGRGLDSMNQRIKQLGGHLDIQRKEGVFIVAFQVPAIFG